MICKLTIAYKRHYKYSCSASTNVWHKIHARAATLGCLHAAWQSRELKKLSLYSTTIIRDSVTRRYSLKSKSYFINGTNKRIHYFHYEFAHMLVDEDNTVQYWSAQFVRLLYKRLLEEENAQTTIFYPSMFVYKYDFIRLWKHLFTACLVSRRRLWFVRSFPRELKETRTYQRLHGHCTEREL